MGSSWSVRGRGGTNITLSPAKGEQGESGFCPPRPGGGEWYYQIWGLEVRPKAFRSRKALTPAKWHYPQPERTHPPTPVSLQLGCPLRRTDPNPRPPGTGLEAHKPGRAPAGPQAASPTRLRLLAPGPASPSKRADHPSHIKLPHLGRLALDSYSSKSRRTQSPVCFA